MCNDFMTYYYHSYIDDRSIAWRDYNKCVEDLLSRNPIDNDYIDDELKYMGYNRADILERALRGEINFLEDLMSEIQEHFVEETVCEVTCAIDDEDLEFITFID